MVLNTQMKHLFSYKMFIRYLYKRIYTLGRDEGSFSEEHQELCWWEPTHHGPQLLGLKPRSICPAASLPSLRHAFGKGPEKKAGQETLRPGSHRACPSFWPLPMPGATESCPPAGTPEHTRVTLKEKLQKLHKSRPWGFKVQLPRWGRGLVSLLFLIWTYQVC